MKYLLSSLDPARIGLVQSVLDAAGISYELRNQAVSQVEVGMPFITELWILDDNDYEDAQNLIQTGNLVEP